VIVFNNLSKEQIVEIADIQINILKKRLKDKKIVLEITRQVKEFLAEKGYDSRYGARPLKRTIQRYIQDPLALLVLENKFKEGDKVEADLDEKSEKIIFKKL
jgi:ATP-dependent Clp protease ATP-binding subunit ClpB